MNEDTVYSYHLCMASTPPNNNIHWWSQVLSVLVIRHLWRGEGGKQEAGDRKSLTGDKEEWSMLWFTVSKVTLISRRIWILLCFSSSKNMRILIIQQCRLGSAQFHRILWEVLDWLFWPGSFFIIYYGSIEARIWNNGHNGRDVSPAYSEWDVNRLRQIFLRGVAADSSWQEAGFDLAISSEIETGTAGTKCISNLLEM